MGGYIVCVCRDVLCVCARVEMYCECVCVGMYCQCVCVCVCVCVCRDGGPQAVKHMQTHPQ